MRVEDFRGARFVKDPAPLWGAGQPSLCISPRVHDFGGATGRRLFYSSKDPRGRVQWCVRQARPLGGDWEPLPGVLLAGGFPGGANGVTAPDVVRLPDGRWRVFVEARDGDGKSAVIASAISEDGRAWLPEAGIRLSPQLCEGGRRPPVGFGTPACVADPGGGWRLYFHELAEDHYYIVSAHSMDGLQWIREPGVRISQDRDGDDYGVYGPHVLKCVDGWVMAFSAWTARPGISGAIWGAWSEDGLTWHRADSPWLTPGPDYDGRVCSEPFLEPSGDGADLYYEGCDPQKNYRICRAHAAFAPP